jgi:chromosome partitioning protein
LVDLDPQGNATMGCGCDKSALEFSVTEVLLGECKISQAATKVESATFYVLPGNSDLTR